MEFQITIEKLENGFEVRVPDREAVKNNAKKNSVWRDPYKEYAFSTAKEVMTFVGKHMNDWPKSGGDQFNEAAAEAFKDD